MSETTSSPSGHLHQISPSSSMSSNDSAPVSEPTSDEQPDLGAFGAVLREYHHLQPIHRVPVYIRPPSSSMASTFHADQSVAGGDELRSRSLRSRTSRNSARSGLSGLSSFTRPTSSSDRPEGSTVWTHYAIAPYLMSQTPVSEEDDSYGGSRQGSDQDSRFDFARPHSHASFSTESVRTVEIVSEHDYPSYEEGSQNPPESSPHPSFESEPAVLVPVSHNDTRLNSRATVGIDDASDLILSVVHGEGTEDSSATSRENLAAMRRDQLSALSSAFSSTVDRNSDQTSTMQLQSQTRPVTTTIASSSSSSSRLSTSLASDATQIPSSIPMVTPGASTTSDVQTGSSSSSTTQYNHAFRSQPVAPRNDIESLYTSTASSVSSKLSLVSYQMPETPPRNVVEESDTGPDASPVAPRRQERGNYGGSHTSTSSVSSTSERSSESVSLKTQRSVTSSSISSMSNLTPTHHAISSHPTGSQQPSTLLQSHPSSQDDAASYTSVGLSTIRSLIFSDPASVQGERVPTSTNVPHSDAEQYRPPSSGLSSLLYEGSRHSGFLEEPIDDEDEVFPRPLAILNQDGFIQNAAPLQQSSGDGRFSPDDGTQPTHPTHYAHTPGQGFIHTPRGIPPPSQTGYLLYHGTNLSQSQPSDVSQSATSRGRSPIISSTTTAVYQHTTLTETHSYSGAPRPAPPEHVLDASALPLPSLSRGHNHGMGYPHSLLGLHVLPTTLTTPDPQDLPHILGDGDLTGDALPTHPEVQALSPSEARVEDDIPSVYAIAAPASPEVEPSLGYLDEALRFIAEERDRWRAATHNKATAAANQDENDEVDGSADNDTPKRKRRRKRSTREGAQSATRADPTIQSTLSGSQDIEEGALTPLSTPKKKKRSKSVAGSASGSTSRSSLLTEAGPISSSKSQARRKEKEFLVPAASTNTGKENTTPTITILKRPTVESTDRNPLLLPVVVGHDSEDDGVLTPRNPVKTRHPDISETLPILTGKTRKRVGRREREREKLAIDLKKQAANSLLGKESLKSESDFGKHYTDDNGQGDVDEEDSSQTEDPIEDPSISRLSLLQNPRRKRNRRNGKKGKEPEDDIVAPTIARRFSKSEPRSPRSHVRLLDLIDDEPDEEEKLSNEDEAIQSSATVKTSSSTEKKRRSRSRKIKSLVHAKSATNLRGDAIAAGVLISSDAPRSSTAALTSKFTTSGTLPSPRVNPNTKRGRLLGLGQQLRQLFPEQQAQLGKVITRFETQGRTPVNIRDTKRKKKHIRSGSDGGMGDVFEVDEDLYGVGSSDAVEEDIEVDPRGAPPRKHDPLVHVFIDHSNILIGLLSYLKRKPAIAANATGSSNNRSPDLFVPKARRTNAQSAFAAVKINPTRPLPIPGRAKKDQPILDTDDSPIPLPSFATLSRSLPARSLPLDATAKGKGQKGSAGYNSHEANSDGYEFTIVQDNERDEITTSASFSTRKTVKPKPRSHLWHAALALILERGRPISRRVVVTSSPLYQPMESIEHLGYDLRVYMRVPDLGDGMDRERKNRISASQKDNGPFLKASHKRHASESTNTDSAGSPGSYVPTHPAYAALVNSKGKIKYREQGVDELLQLKLHQALAAAESVPPGSTIVLATGDGNIGQFNEEGFLGSVRTALKYGWKVELYAWEEGLSRAWRREFADVKEFRIISLEQFADSLVESVFV